MIAAVIVTAGMLLAKDYPMASGGEFWSYIILSSLAGIVFGDFLLFAAMRKVGLRRTNVLFATNALFASMFGWVLLDESLGGQTFLAILFGFCGVVLAVIYGKRRDLMHQWKAVTPPLWFGVMLGLSAAVCQALGVNYIRPAMAARVDLVAATLAQAFVGAVVFWMAWPFDKRRRDKPLIPDWNLLLPIALNALFGLGAAFLLAALETGNVATVTILASTTPVLILPFIWIKTRMMPATGAGPAPAWWLYAQHCSSLNARPLFEP